MYNVKLNLDEFNLSSSEVQFSSKNQCKSVCQKEV